MSFIAGTKCLSSRTRSAFHRAGHVLRSVRIVDARARVACFIALELFSVPWRAGRERTPRPFRRFLIYRSEKFLRFLTRRTREATSTVLRLIFASLSTLCLQKSKATTAVRSACCLIARRKFSADLKKHFRLPAFGWAAFSQQPGRGSAASEDFLFRNHSPKTRQLRFILHAFGTRPVRIRAPRPIWSIGPNWPLPRPGCWRMRTQSVFHRGHAVSFIAPGIFCVLWTNGRGRTCLPFCGLSRSAIF